MRYVYIEEGKAHEIIPEFDPVFPGVPMSERYSPDFIAKCVKAADSAAVEFGWIYDEGAGVFSAPPEPEPEHEAEETEAEDADISQ
jgi:hypothetical protein